MHINICLKFCYLNGQQDILMNEYITEYQQRMCFTFTSDLAFNDVKTVK